MSTISFSLSLDANVDQYDSINLFCEVELICKFKLRYKRRKASLPDQVPQLNHLKVSVGATKKLPTPVSSMIIQPFDH